MEQHLNSFELGDDLSGFREPPHLVLGIDEGFIDFHVKDTFVARNEGK
jgi:hypothetical protein|tara:strand:+ start:50 stop:193 length:144 start_codon:yes stop_codon:yes gene_type:complete